jgi:hypothetical protein
MYLQKNSRFAEIQLRDGFDIDCKGTQHLYSLFSGRSSTRYHLVSTLPPLDSYDLAESRYSLRQLISFDFKAIQLLGLLSFHAKLI